MSVQAGVFYFDQRPVDRGLADVLSKCLGLCGTETVRQLSQPGLLMLSSALNVTPEDSHETQPYVSARGNVMTWDGRLDNREDLIIQLWHDLPPETTDVALAMSCYERWGTSAFAKLIGDWSLVVRDPNNEILALASDYMGIRPIHYTVQGGAVSWATTIECLVHLHKLYGGINQRYVFRVLSDNTSFVLTPYQEIEAIPAGHGIVFSRNGRKTVSRFWSLPPRTIRYRRHSEYEDHLRWLFTTSVKDRLRSNKVVWSHLSGGLDSSTIVCMADLLIRQGVVPAPELATLSFISDESPEADERQFIRCVEEHCNKGSHYIQTDGVLEKVDPSYNWISPKQPRHATRESFDLIQRSGGRVLLTGTAGDCVMANYAWYYHDVAELLKYGHMTAALRLARQRALFAKRSIWDILALAGMELLPKRPLVPWTMGALLAKKGGSHNITDRNIADSFYLKLEFADWWRQDMAAHTKTYLECPNLANRGMIAELMAISENRRAQSPSEVPHVVQTHPYLDRRLVEYMLAVPMSISAPPGKPRHLMRLAFAPILPLRIQRRFSKNMLQSAQVRSTREVVLRWLERPDSVRVLQLEFLDRDRLLKYLRQLRDFGKEPAHFQPLLQLELWLECREIYGRNRLSTTKDRSEELSPTEVSELRAMGG